MNNLKKEDGYILIVIVGILTVFSLMSVKFATLSRLETKAARNYADSVKCETVAKAGLEHAIYAIRLDKFGTDTIAYNNDSGDTNYDYSGDASWPGDGIFDGSDYDNDGDSTDDSKWVYFPATTLASDIRLPGNLRARYAVLITDDREARVNINATGNHPGGGSHISNEGWSTFEIDLEDLIERKIPGKGNVMANYIIDARFGTNTLPGVTGDDDPGKIPDPKFDGIDNDGDWTIGNDSNGNGIPDSAESNVDVPDSDEYEDEANEFNPISPIGDDVPFDILAEVEIMDTSTYTSKLEDLFYAEGIDPADLESLKGYLTTYSADTILCPAYTLDSPGTSTTMLNINALINNEGKYDDAEVYYDSDKKVEMLIDVLTAGGVPDVERQQLAVNIKDFIDSDGTSTTYLDISGDTYYGVDKGTPYINEVEAKPGDIKFIELYNPHDSEIDIENWTITLDADTTTITIGNVDILADGYYVIGESAGAGIDIVDANIANLDSGGEELILRDSSGKVVQVTNYGPESGNTNKTQELNDPRPIPLTATPSDPWSWATSSASNHTRGLPNDGFDPAAGFIPQCSTYS